MHLYRKYIKQGLAFLLLLLIVCTCVPNVYATVCVKELWTLEIESFNWFVPLQSMDDDAKEIVLALGLYAVNEEEALEPICVLPWYVVIVQVPVNEDDDVKAFNHVIGRIYVWEVATEVKLWL